MSIRLLGTLALLMTCIGTAAEIVAWKVPLSRYVGNGLEAEGVERCESAPEASPFFNQGDVLWNLKEIVTNELALKKPTSELLVGNATKTKLITKGNPAFKKPTPEWLLWNASTSTLVAKGDWLELWSIHQMLRVDELQKQCRLTAKLYPVTDASLPVSEDSSPVAEVSWVARSGMDSSTIMSGGGYDVSAKSNVTISMYEAVFDMKIGWSSSSTGQPDFHASTSITLHSGASMWIARDFDGERGFDLVISGEIESTDGISNLERTVIQKGNQSRGLRWVEGTRVSKFRRIGESGWLSQTRVSPRIMMNFLSSGWDHYWPHPFAQGRTKMIQFEFPHSQSVRPPAALNAWLDHEVLDVSEWFEKSVPSQKANGDFIGYDPIGECLYAYGAKRQFAEAIASLFGYLDGCPQPYVSITMDALGQTRIVSRSGAKAKVARGGSKPERVFEIEPTIGENDDIVDLRMFFEGKANPKKVNKVNNAVTLTSGEWLEVAAGKFGTGEKAPMRVKAEVFRPGQ